MYAKSLSKLIANIENHIGEPPSGMVCGLTNEAYLVRYIKLLVEGTN